MIDSNAWQPTSDYAELVASRDANAHLCCRSLLRGYDSLAMQFAQEWGKDEQQIRKLLGLKEDELSQRRHQD